MKVNKCYPDTNCRYFIKKINIHHYFIAPFHQVYHHSISIKHMAEKLFTPLVRFPSIKSNRIWISKALRQTQSCVPHKHVIFRLRFMTIPNKRNKMIKLCFLIPNIVVNTFSLYHNHRIFHSNFKTHFILEYRVM